LFPVSSHFCVVVLKENLSNIFVVSKSAEKRLQDFKCLNVKIRVNSLTT
jgi:hypothetical protein